LGFIGKPDFSGTFHTTDFKIPVAYNHQGFRHTHKQNNSAERTLYILGDSYGWGWGVGPGKSISDHIAAEFPEWNVVNYALPGYGTVQQKMVFERFVQANLKRDDAVMILHFGNDFDDNVRKTADNAPHAYLSETGEVNISLPPTEPWSLAMKQKLKDASYFYNYLAYVINYQKLLSNHRKEETILTKQKEKSKKEPTLSQDDPKIVVMEYLLSEIQSECDSKDVPLLMVRVPYRNEYGESPPHQLNNLELRSPYRPAIREIAERLDIPFHDLSAYLCIGNRSMKNH